jgi:hypothetical protein
MVTWRTAGNKEPMSCRVRTSGHSAEHPCARRHLASDEHLGSESATLPGPHNSEPPITPSHEVGATPWRSRRTPCRSWKRCSGVGHDAAGHHASMGDVSQTRRTRGVCAASDLDAYASPQCYFSSRGDAEVHSTAWLLCAPWATRSAKLSPARSTGTPTNTLRSETDPLPPTNTSARSQSRSEDPRLGGTHQSEP